MSIVIFLLDSKDPKTASNAVAGSSDVNDVNGSSSSAPPISILPCLAEEPDDQDQDEEEADETSFLTRKQTKAWVAPKKYFLNNHCLYNPHIDLRWRIHYTY